MAENEAMFVGRAIRSGLLDPEKGEAALLVYAQLRQKGVQFSIGEFLVNQGLLTSMALAALEQPAQPRLRAVSTVADYELIEVLGEGHNGVVFKARQKSLDRLVALKILNAHVAGDIESLKRFQNEARATARLTHPNVVMGIDVGSSEGLHYFAMEYVDGGSLRDLIDSAPGTMPELTALNLARQVSEGLRAAHALGMIHRDVKPDNILLTKDGQAKLADLGITQVQAIDAGEDGEFWASPPYVAPEVIQGVLKNDPRSDIYSLGATLYEMLAGNPPFIGKTPEETMGMHLNYPIPEVRGLRGDVCEETGQLLEKMMEKDPDERIASATALSAALLKIINKNKPALVSKTTMPKPVLRRPVRTGRHTTGTQHGARGRYGAQRSPRGRR